MMIRKGFVYLTGAMIALATGCQPADDGTAAKLDETITRLSAIEHKLDQQRAAAPAGRAPTPARPNRPTPGVVYQVPVHPDDAFRGGAAAKVTLVQAFEFACPYCAQVHPIMEALREAYDDDNPNRFQAVRRPPGCGQRRRARGVRGGPPGSLRGVRGRAVEAGLGHRAAARARSREAIACRARGAGDQHRARRAHAARRHGRRVQGQADPGPARAVQGRRPRHADDYVNGQIYAGPRTVEGFKQVIDGEIAKADRALAKGGSLAGYYAQLISTGQPTL